MGKQKSYSLCNSYCLGEIIAEKQYNTSAFESVSARRCLISLAIEKKTSSTLRFVFALCNSNVFQPTTLHSCQKITQLEEQATHSFKEFDPILISKRLSFGCRHSL